MPYDSDHTLAGELTLGDSAVYRVCIQGELMTGWSDYLKADEVLRVDDAEFGLLIVLTCTVLDQAGLIGMLNTLDEWGATLLWLECIAVVRKTRHTHV